MIGQTERGPYQSQLVVLLTLARIVISSPELLRSSFPAERALSRWIIPVITLLNGESIKHTPYVPHWTWAKIFWDIPLSLYIEPPDALDGNVLPGWPGRALLCKHRRRGSKYSATEQLTTALSSLHQSASKCTAAAQSWYAFPLHLAVN